MVSTAYLSFAFGDAVTLSKVRARLQLPQSATTFKRPSTLVGNLLGGFTLLKDIFRTEGLAGTMRGIGLRLVRRPLSSAIVWTAYELLGRDN